MSTAPLVSLESISESIDYGVTASATGSANGPKFLRITDIQDGAVDWASVPWCECSERERTKAQLRPGDIVFARTGATTGKSFLIRECPDDCVFASYLIRVRLKQVADPVYVSHFFQSQDYWTQITQTVRGAAQPGVNATSLAALELPLPPLPEQRRIAAILDQAEALRAKRRTGLAKLDTLAQSIFIEMFGDPHVDPPIWGTGTLAELGQVSTGGTPSSNLEGMFDGPIPFITPGDLESGGSVKRSLTREGASEVRTVRAGATLVCCIGATIGKMGKAKIESAFNQQINAIEWGPQINDNFGIYVMRFFKSKIKSWGASTTLPIFKKSSFEKIRIPVPPIQQQHLFSDRVASIEQFVIIQQDSLTQFDTLFASLQHRAFRGEL